VTDINRQLQSLTFTKVWLCPNHWDSRNLDNSMPSPYHIDPIVERDAFVQHIHFFSSFYFTENEKGPLRFSILIALWTVHRKMMKFGTLVVMLMNSNWTNFWPFRTNSIAPPPVQSQFNIEMVLTFEPFDLETWNLVHLVPLIMLITTNTVH